MTNLKLFVSTFLLCLLATATYAQLAAFPQITVPVNQNGTLLQNPFAGGLSSPQFSSADLNQDGVLDIVIFDRSSNTVLTYLNNFTTGNGAYKYAPEYSRTFPELVDYVLLRDYNNDGAMDIFCAPLEQGKQEIRVFQGFFEGKVLKFKPFKFYYPNCTVCDPCYIYYPDQIPGLWNNFPIAGSDYPAVDDIDGDGDLDILGFSAGSSVYLTYLKNMSVERGYGLDSLQYELEDRCWGKMFENGLVKCRACLSGSNKACAFCLQGGEVEERDAAHPGASITTFDHDNDGDKDLLLGNISFNCLNLLFNGGTPDTAWMTSQDTLFPSEDVVVDLLSFPTAYYLDVDNDGVKDLLVSPGSPTLHEDQNNVWWYANTNPNGKASFELQTKKLFTSGMIDLGTATHPAFADVNADGLMDMVVGNYGYFSPDLGGVGIRFTNANLYLYLNTGTFDKPAFTLSNSNWLNMGQYAPNDYDFAPAFGDLDNDGDLDLVVGSNLGALYVFFNSAGASNPMNLTEDFNPLWISMDVGQISTPAIYDLDSDGLPDILMGEKNGNINFYKNIGSPTEPLFNADENAAPNIPILGAINTQSIPNGLGYSSPIVLQENGSATLLTGTVDGQLEAYALQGATPAAFPVMDAKWGNINPGRRSTPSLADLNSDGKLELVVGNQRGGMQLFSTELKSFTTPSPTNTPNSETVDFLVQPNPSSGSAQILLKGRYPGQKEWQLFDAIGRLIAEGVNDANTIDLPIQNLVPGVYTVRLRAGIVSGVRKLVKI